MEYAYRNSDLCNIKGERWKDIPGLVGYFLISNFGRIKRSEYQMEYRNGAIYIKPEKIIKPSIVKQLNKFIGDDTSHLCVKITLSGQRHNFTVARLVYYCFVRPFDLIDPDIRILTRQSTSATQSKPVAQYNIKGKHIQNFDSVKAATALGVNLTCLSAACRGLHHTCKGYKWGFA